MKPHKNILKNLEVQHEFHQTSKIRENILALDFGEKFCGLAFYQNGVSLPLGVYPREVLFTSVKDTIRKKHIQKMVIGLPVSSDGSENEICRQIRALVPTFENLMPVVLVNERFSSQNIIISDNHTRKDDLAALQILEFYLARTFSD